jgi:hypothetical protein
VRVDIGKEAFSDPAGMEEALAGRSYFYTKIWAKLAPWADSHNSRILRSISK